MVLFNTTFLLKIIISPMCLDVLYVASGSTSVIVHLSGAIYCFLRFYQKLVLFLTNILCISIYALRKHTVVRVDASLMCNVNYFCGLFSECHLG